MAADMGLSPENLETETAPPDKGRVVGDKLTGLMERLRGRMGQHKSWRITLMADKRYHTDALEKSCLQSCLDKLHRAMKIISQQSLVERLELIARQLGLSFSPPVAPDNQVVLGAEMFQVIIVLEGQSGIRDVRVGHQESPVRQMGRMKSEVYGESTSEDLLEVLSKGDFDEFISHVQGLLDIYRITGDKKQKTKGFLALSSLESDLNRLAQLQSSINGVANYIHKSPLGILLPRRGGHPMKLIYFVSPYDLLCKKTNSSHAMTVEAITEHELGHSVTVCMEPCSGTNKLQTIELMSVKTNTDGKNFPSFQGLNNLNSASLAASFVLVLPQPIPISKSIICAIQEASELDIVCGEEQPLMSILLQQYSSGKITSTKELFVTLPDQQHAYYVRDSGDGCLEQPGALVTKIPFKHPTSVPKVLNLLRQQLMFNSVIQSIVRPAAKREYESAIVFELTAMSMQFISVMFEHPLSDSMITAEFDLSDITSVKCRLCMNNRDENICCDDFVSRAFQRCFSIPVSLRCMIRKAQEQIRLLVPPEPVPRLVVKPRWTWSSLQTVTKAVVCSANVNVNSVALNVVTNLPNPPPYPRSVDNWAHGSHVEMRKFASAPMNRTFMEPPPPSEDERHPNPLLSTLLDTGSPAVDVHQNIINESPMLSKLLEENTSVATNPFPAPNPKKRLTKRKSSKDITAGKSPKHRMSDTDMTERTNASDRLGYERYGQGIAEKHIDLDSSGGSYDEPVRPASVGSVGGQSSTGSVIDLTDIGESHVKKLENTLDSIMHKEGRVNMMHPMNSQIPGAGDLMDMQMHMSDFANSQNPHAMHGPGDGSGDFNNQQVPPPPWGSRQTPPIPTSRNSPHHGVGPKNEKISTSLEDLLLGPGGREMEGPNSGARRGSVQQQRRQSLKRQNSFGRAGPGSGAGPGSLDGVPVSGCATPDVFSPVKTSPSIPLSSSMHFPMSSPSHMNTSVTFPVTLPNQISDLSPSHPLSFPVVKSEPVTSDIKLGLAGSQSAAIRTSVNSVPHVVTSGKPSLSALKAQLEMKNDVNLSGGCIISQEKDFKQEDCSSSLSSQSLPQVMKLKLRQYDSISPPESDGSKSRSSTFDFHSDDDEDFPLPLGEKISVVSSSPTRRQISHKRSKGSNFKLKQKDHEKELKRTLSLETGKRKRDKEESRKERKKKRGLNSYSVENELTVYESTTVDVVGGTENNYRPMPKLKITKSGVKMSVENSNVLPVKDVKPVEKEEKCDKIDKLNKEAVVKIEKVEKYTKKLEKDKELTSLSVKIVKDVKETKDVKEVKEVKEKEKCEKVLTPTVRVQSASDEGIFDKINAMKSESITKTDGETNEEKTPVSTVDTNISSSKKSNSSKSQKPHKSQRSNSVAKTDVKITRTPTIKLKPIVVPPNTLSVSSSAPSRTSGTAGTPTTPKSVTPSPTSTTIGRIGAVSLATSGSQKQISAASSLNKSPQSQSGSGSNKTSSISTSKGVSSLATHSSSKSSSNLQKNIQIQGSSSGKNSPVPQSSKSGHSRSSSVSSLTSNSKIEKSLNKNSSGRTSSPLSDRERLKSSSGSRSASGRDRDREKSSSSKNSVPTTTVITQETAASVLSFLNPKANKISSLPKIPKVSSSANSQKATTPTSGNSSISSPSVPTTAVPNTTSAKFTKGASQTSVSNYNKGNNPNFSNLSKTNSSNNTNSSQRGGNLSNTFNKGTGYSSNSTNRSQNSAVAGNAYTNRTGGNNSPNTYPQKGNSNQYKGHNQNNPNNTNSGFRHGVSGGSNSSQNRNTGTNQTHRGNNPGNTGAYPNKGSNSSVPPGSAHRGSSNSAPIGNRSKSVDNVPSGGGNRPPLLSSNTNNSSSVRASNSGPNAPKGPGPPVSQSSGINVKSVDDGQTAGKSSSFSVHSSGLAAGRARKGSLSAVIDKLTCKIAGPAESAKDNQVVIDESPASPEPDRGGPCVEKNPEKKVVIFDAPASPEPEGVSLSDSGPTSGAYRGNKDSIVSIPLDEQVGINVHSSKYSGDINVHKDKNDIDKNIPNSFSKPLNTVSSPKIIPLNSSREKTSPAKCISSRHSHKLVKQNSVEHLLGSKSVNGELSKEDEIKRMSKDDSYLTHNRVSTPDIAAMKSNAGFTADKTKDEAFQENIENIIGRRKPHAVSINKAISSPGSSPVSSPENGLIIDCPVSPRHLQNKTNSPQCNPVTDSTKMADTLNSTGFIKPIGIRNSPSKLKSSPLDSPLEKDISDSSPGYIDDDDDLMDAALTLGN